MEKLAQNSADNMRSDKMTRDEAYEIMDRHVNESREQIRQGYFFSHDQVLAMLEYQKSQHEKITARR